MGRNLGVAFLVCVTLLAAPRAARPAGSCGDPPDLLILLDRSGSMSLNNKWTDAKTAINNVLTAFAGTIRFGLLLFPTHNSCVANTVQVGCGDNTQAAIMAVLNSTSPSGNQTPLTYALYAADTYLKGIDPTKAKYVLVISDGSENCWASPTPTQGVQQLFTDGIKTYVVGFGTSVNATVLNAMATAGGTALSGSTKYYEATNQTQLNSALQSIASAVTCCGNGVLDTGEKCDTAITSGAGACPTLASCNDNNSCTTDTITGSGCNAVCTHTTITTPQNGDGCCPTGANSLTDSDCPVVCGNGVVESGETCDTAISSGSGKCPTLASCNDSNVCTADSISGSGCTAKCQNTALTPNLTAKDGCCPSGATSLTDLDCAVVCGNGVVESGESCDTAITSGTGKCPTLGECSDGNVCTSDFLSGSSCTLACAHTALTPNLTAKDGCCPTGATSLTDLDCPASCGNGVLDSGETCDPKITSGTGKCPTTSDCNDNNVCTADTLTGSACTLKCQNTTLTPSLVTKDGCCPTGATSLTDLDCVVGCGNGVLEAGETCDPKITSGTGKCPVLSDCDDGQSCTTDLLAGGACTLVCSNISVAPDATKSDGCCPPGASAVTDKDCTAACGNGILEPGELCDPAITSGVGACKTIADCADQDPCTVETLAGTGCAVNCTSSAAAPNASKKDGCCPKGHSLVTDADCPPPCDPDHTTNCVDLCKGVTCPSGQYCDRGKCVGFPDGGMGGGDAGPTGDGGEGWYAEGTGCNCRLDGTGGGGPVAVLVLLGLLAARVRRRRR